ncbi:MAG TPA: hypothetical protein VFU81_15440 [Thermomicrobiales bacterium]|nr:hypothetical protein [Thermomicrobiales bacterium]
MDGAMFDRIARTAGKSSSRRRLLGGLGAVVGALALEQTVGRAAASPKAGCMKDCTQAAQTCRQGCAGSSKTTSPTKRECLAACKTTFAGCRTTCVGSHGGGHETSGA